MAVGRELGRQWQQRPARTSAFTPLVAPLVFGFARHARGTEGSTETVLVNHYRWNSRNSLAAHEAPKDNGKRSPYPLFAGNRRAPIQAASPSRGLSRSPLSHRNFLSVPSAPRAQYEQTRRLLTNRPVLKL